MLHFVMGFYESQEDRFCLIWIEKAEMSPYAYPLSSAVAVWESTHGRNKGKSIDEVTFTAAVTLEHKNRTPPGYFPRQHTRKPIVGSMRYEPGFLSETVTITDIDHGIRRNADGTSPEGAAGEFQRNEYIESSNQYVRPRARVKYEISALLSQDAPKTSTRIALPTLRKALTKFVECQPKLRIR
ncbi:hypothetical protein ARMGADRAFT_1036954 [Armillaria gallica]|uniref:Uncharacterized protein n=1 Tax=Armillaria gallica TaxID=47427 RepID=A0A2H3D6P2_ARMGA|nr:hypothetical protein ARMGADRAFT_1036954 [Armillaria gallica]